ncbi:MAG: PEP-CTERM sorting domain-containing protein [Terriglobia bacterium]
MFWISVPLIVGLSASWAAADVLYSNFGTGLSFDTNVSDAYFINQSEFSETTMPCPASLSCEPPTTIAAQFQSSVNATFTEAQLPLFLTSFNTGPNTLDVYLESDSSGSPGSIIAGFELTNLLTSTPGVVQVGSAFAGVTLISGSSGNPALNANTPYWLAVYAPDAGTVAAWSWNPNCVFDPVSGTFSGCDIGSSSDLAFNIIPSPTGPWTPAPGVPRPAFEIDGTPVVTPPSTVPEPGDGILFGTGLLALWLLRRRLQAASAR